MNSLDSNFVSDYSQLQDFLDAHLTPIQPSTDGYSAQTFYSDHCGYLNEVISPDIPSSPRSLNDFSISHLPSTENQLLLPESSLEDLYNILSCDSASEPVDDDFALTDSTLTNSQHSQHSQQLAQKWLLEDSLVSFSQPSPCPVAIPVAKVGPLNKDTQQQVTTETVEFKAPESSGSGELLPSSLAVTHEQSEKPKAFKRALAQFRKEEASKRTYEQSGKLKVCRDPEKSKIYRKNYEQSEKRKAYMKAYRKSEKWKAYRKNYEQSEEREAYKRAYKRAYHKAYQKPYEKAYNEVFMNTLDKEQAKIAGRQARALIKKSNKANNSDI